MELSVVIPCLDEADTIGTCVEKALRSMREHQIEGEVVVADNGSRDESVAIATRLGARVVHVAEKGYGSALMAGIEAAAGLYVVMGDADDSYDFLDTHRFVEKLREGHDLVQGCRLPSGGGRIAPGAMPLSHRWAGNPAFSLLASMWFGSPIHDVYCGFRGFRKDFYLGLAQRCTGMEFATEMIIRSSLAGARIAEIPIVLHVDGRKERGSHLRTVRDGWRTLRLYLMYTPRWLFLVPGLLLGLLGLLGYAVAMPGLTLGGAHFDAHTLAVASLLILMGYQSVVFAALTRTFAIGEGLLPMDPRSRRLYQIVTLERGVLAGAVAIGLGIACLAWALYGWHLTGYGPLDYGRTMRVVIPGVLLTALGFQTILSSFFLSILGLRRR